MRIFAGVWPPDRVVRVLSALQRPHVPGVRWTDPARWHVTLAFLGEVPDDAVPALGAALVEVAARAAGPPEATLGPAVAVLGRGVLCVPVAGLDQLALTTREALVGDAARPGPFSGHLTLARAKGRRRMPAALAGEQVQASWRVGELRLVASTTGADGPRYTAVVRATVPS